MKLELALCYFSTSVSVKRLGSRSSQLKACIFQISLIRQAPSFYLLSIFNLFMFDGP